MPPFKYIKERLSLVAVGGVEKVNNPYEEILEIIRILLRGVA